MQTDNTPCQNDALVIIARILSYSLESERPED